MLRLLHARTSTKAHSFRFRFCYKELFFPFVSVSTASHIIWGGNNEILPIKIRILWINYLIELRTRVDTHSIPESSALIRNCVSTEATDTSFWPKFFFCTLPRYIDGQTKANICTQTNPQHTHAYAQPEKERKNRKKIDANLIKHWVGLRFYFSLCLLSTTSHRSTITLADAWWWQPHGCCLYLAFCLWVFPLRSSRSRPELVRLRCVCVCDTLASKQCKHSKHAINERMREWADVRDASESRKEKKKKKVELLSENEATTTQTR